MDNKNYFRLRIQDSDIQRIRDSANDGAKPTSIRVKMSATHSGLVNKNFWFYPPKGMSDGVNSFIAPYNKPVTTNHDPYSAPIGRVKQADYISYGLNPYLEKATIADKGYIKKINDFVNSKQYKEVGYKGLGEIQLIAEINDADSIEKLLDRRYLTVSVGGDSTAGYCSICGTNKKQSDCGHYRGAVYDKQTCFYIADTLDYRHVSYVSEPADESAISEVLDSDENTTIEILDFTIGNKSKNMKLTLEQFKAKYGTYADFADYMQTLKVGALASPEKNASAAAIGFVFADDKQIPMFDKEHLVVAHKLIQDNLEDSDTKTQILDNLTIKAKESFNIDNIEDAFAALAKDAEPVTTSVEPLVLTDAHLDAIALKVVDGLKKSVNLDESYTAQRVRALEKHSAVLEDSFSNLESKYKSNVMLQILSLEDKIGDKDRETALSLRSLLSLEDHLADLVSMAQKPVISTPVEDGNLEPATVLDANGKPVAVVEPVVPATTDEVLSVKEIHDAYRTTLKTKGFKAASAYLEDLKANKKLPKNFTF